MASILNPTENLWLDILYYFVVIWFGPTFLWKLLIFDPKKHRLHDAYRLTGVECIGIITHRHVTVYRTTITRIETRRTYKIRYAYKAPGTNTVYIKDFVTVTKQELMRRLLVVVVLPGQPTSGVPKFLLTERPGVCKKTALYILSIALVLFSIYLFAVLYAVTLNCSSNSVCYIKLTPVSFVLSIVAVTAIGMLFAWVNYLSDRASVPGSVWRAHCRPSNETTRPESAPTAPRALYEDLNDRPVPMAEAVTVLNAGEETLAHAAADAGVAIAHPVMTLESNCEDDEESNGDDKEDIPTAHVLELV